MIPQVRPAALARWFETTQAASATRIALAPPAVLDVREPHELHTARVTPAGFELITIPMGSVPAQLANMNPNRPVAVLCHHGSRSQRVAVFLESQGFMQVANIAGGIDAWAVELDPSIARY